MQFSQYGDAHLSKRQSEQLLGDASLDITEMIKYEIVKAIYNTSAYTIASAANGSKSLASDLIDQIKEQIDAIDWENAISEYHEQEIDQIKTDRSYGEKQVPCHKCNTLYPRSKFIPVALHTPGMPGMGVFSEPTEILCYGLCPRCIQEYTYQFNGLHFTCSYCSNRYGYGNSVLGQPYSRELCGQCLDNPLIGREESRVKAHLSHSNKYKLPATLTLKQWFTTLKHFENKCAYCDGAFEVLEHFIPVSLKGGTTQTNCLPACEKCNLRKKNNHPKRFERIFSCNNMARIKAYFATC